MERPLASYLRNHEAAAAAGVAAFRRVASSQRDRPYGPELAALRDEVAEDRRSYQTLLRVTRTPPDRALAVALRAAERVSRLKPNGRLLRRALLSDLIEVEGLLDAVRAKSAGWLALLAVEHPPWADQVDLVELHRRALDQAGRLEEIHRTVSRRTLTT